MFILFLYRDLVARLALRYSKKPAVTHLLAPVALLVWAALGTHTRAWMKLRQVRLPLPGDLQNEELFFLKFELNLEGPLAFFFFFREYTILFVLVYVIVLMGSTFCRFVSRLQIETSLVGWVIKKGRYILLPHTLQLHQLWLVMSLIQESFCTRV